MGLMDAFNAEDRITLKVSDYAKVLKEDDERCDM